MAAKYEKLDLAAFKKKLAGGEYKSLTGARRAVGRMTTWSEADKDKARASADLHFGSTRPPKPAKKAAKKVAKKAKKKAAKKVTKKKVVAKAKAEPVAKKSVKKVKRRQAKGPAEAKGVNSVMGRIQETNAQIEVYGNAILYMGRAKEIGCPVSDIQEGAKAAQGGLTAAVNNLCMLTKEASLSGLTTGGNGAVNKAWDTAVDATQASLGGFPPPPQEPASLDEG
jgi:hypothetical protein